MHTQALVVMGVRRKDDLEKPPITPDDSELKPGQDTGTLVEEHPVSVVEQRVSNLAQGALCIVLMTRPFQHVLGLVPRGVLAGLL
jgi:hypothetical protein